ncbi:MAG: J domain-containing protein [Spirochaetaceae bacterium]|jgi:hypothetical protein|nr:J domain-containing protein [Spirochaetaceae bacterium]
MGILDRLGTLLKSRFAGEISRSFDFSRGSSGGDPDLEAAYRELDELLGHGAPRQNGEGEGARKSHAENRGPEAAGARNSQAGNRKQGAAAPPPESLRRDFAELGLPFGASAGECKGAYKKLLKIHHPDRHAKHPGNFQKATAKSARINAAYDRIERWREGKE